MDVYRKFPGTKQAKCYASVILSSIEPTEALIEVYLM